MEKLLRRVISLVCAIAMVVTCMAFTPAKVDAGETLPVDQWTDVGAWQLYNGNDAWCSYATMEYTSTGDELGNTTMTLTNSPGGVWNDVEYGLGARLKGYTENPVDTDGDPLVYDRQYDCVITYTSNKAGHVITNLEGVEYKDPDKDTKDYWIESGTNKQLTVATFDHNQFASTNDITFYLGWLETGTVLTISKVEFVKNDDGWTPVPNTNPDGEPVYEQAGLFTLNAMFSPKYTLYGKMKYKVSKNPTKLEDTTIKVTSTSGFHDAWSASASLKNYCEQVVVDGQKGLASGDKYMPTIKVKSNKKTEEDEHGNMQTVMVVISGKTYEFPLTAEPGEENVFTATEDQALKYNSSKPDVDFELDCVQKDTELTITEVSFEPADKGWTKVENEQTVNTGKWALFARTGATVEEGQWGALSYKTAEHPESMADTQIKVRSSSGWHDAWATLAMLPNYLNQGEEGPEGTNLEVGRTYKPVITYSSTKATSMDDSGDPKTVLLSVDNSNLEFPLEATEDKTITLDPFTYENQKPETPNDVVFNLDQVEPDTVLCIKSLSFEPVDDGWTPVPNRKYTAVTNDGMELYARMGETVEEGSWGKTSYKYDEGYDKETASYKDLTVKTRTTSGWYVTNNPASLVYFNNFAETHNMTEANKYKISFTLEADRTDEVKKDDGSTDEQKNYVKIIVDGTKEFEIEEPLPDGEAVTVTTSTEEEPYFVYEGKSPHVSLVLDKFTPGATLRITDITVEQDPDDKDWTAVPNNAATQVGKWILFANFNAETESWGKMFYSNSKEEPTEMGDTTMYCYSTSGWFGARSIRAILSRYTQGKLNKGQAYSAHITIESDKNCNGLDDNGNEKGIEVTIDNNPYVIPIYKGKYEYVIPMIKPYSGTGGAADNVQFNFDTLTPTTIVNISDVSFGDTVTEIPEISALDLTPQSNGQVLVEWEHDGNKIYGTATNKASYEVYVDEAKVTTAEGNERSFTTGILSDGPHKVKVVAAMGSQKTTGLEGTVDVHKESTTQTPTETQDPTGPTQVPTETQEPGPTQDPTETQTQGPTQAPTQAPTETAKPTAAPATTKATVVTKPGKAAVKKVVKKKKSAKKIKVTIKKVAGATKYQIAVYKTKKNAKKNKKAIVKKKVSKLKVTIKSKKLKGKKTVYVRVRAWNTAGYGAWSKVKKSKKK